MELVGVRRRHGPGGVRWLVTVLVPEAVPGRRTITYECALYLNNGGACTWFRSAEGSQLPLHAHLARQGEMARAQATCSPDSCTHPNPPLN